MRSNLNMSKVNELGVRCGDCSRAISLDENPPAYLEEDARVKKLFACPKLPQWKWVHQDLIHDCAVHSPSGELKKYPVTPIVERLALEQEAADPGNTILSARAVASGVFKMPLPERMQALKKAKDGNAEFGGMVETFIKELEVKKKIQERTSAVGKKIPVGGNAPRRRF